jgi:hypothetical protein
MNILQLWKQTNAGSKKKGVNEPWSNLGKSQNYLY